MGTIIAFPGHKFHRRYGVIKCEICGGGEASLPTDCPGHMLSEIEKRYIIAGRVDYAWDKGWHAPKPRVGCATAPYDSLAFDDVCRFYASLEVFNDRDC